MAVWAYAYPPGFKSCGSSEQRNRLVERIQERGLLVECRKEDRREILDLTKFNLTRYGLDIFIAWAEHQTLDRVYEQPGYFWFLRTDLLLPGFVYFEY